MRAIDESTPDHGERSLRHDVARVSLWALVVLMGIQLGGGLYEHTAAVPQWSTMSGEHLPDALLRSAQAHAAFAFWPFVSPTLVVVAMINAFAAASARGRVRQWWLCAAGIELFVQLATWTYFVPELRAFVGAALPPDELEARALAWVRLDTARVVLEAFAWSLALAALTHWRGAVQRGGDRDDTVAAGPA